MNFNDSYQHVPPWDIGRPQKEIIQLMEAGEIKGSTLDIGCGTGENALYISGFGLPTLGVDTAPLALKAAKEKAQVMLTRRGVCARFKPADALDLAPLNETFYSAIDVGFFHTLSDSERPLFANSLASVLKAGGTYFMLCFSERETRPGPRRVTEAEIRSTFSTGWTINYIRPACFELADSNDCVDAWLASITRTKELPSQT